MKERIKSILKKIFKIVFRSVLVFVFIIGLIACVLISLLAVDVHFMANEMRELNDEISVIEKMQENEAAECDAMYDCLRIEHGVWDFEQKVCRHDCVQWKWRGGEGCVPFPPCPEGEYCGKDWPSPPVERCVDFGGAWDSKISTCFYPCNTRPGRKGCILSEHFPQLQNCLNGGGRWDAKENICRSD